LVNFPPSICAFPSLFARNREQEKPRPRRISGHFEARSKVARYRKVTTLRKAHGPRSSRTCAVVPRMPRVRGMASYRRRPVTLRSPASRMSPRAHAFDRSTARTVAFCNKARSRYTTNEWCRCLTSTLTGALAGNCNTIAPRHGRGGSCRVRLLLGCKTDIRRNNNLQTELQTPPSQGLLLCASPLLPMLYPNLNWAIAPAAAPEISAETNDMIVTAVRRIASDGALLLSWRNVPERGFLSPSRRPFHKS
jgi:hypothetical protein